jgi:dTMP kinase
VIELATDGLKPDLTLFFDVPVEKAIARTNSRTDAGEQKNRMDSETAAFYERVRRAYLRIAANEPQRFIIIDGDGAIDEIKIKVSQIVTDFLNR